LTQNQNPHIKKASNFETPQFLVKHYAGDVVYDVAGFVEKNKDILTESISETLVQSSHPLLQVFFSSAAGPQ